MSHRPPLAPTSPLLPQPGRTWWPGRLPESPAPASDPITVAPVAPVAPAELVELVELAAGPRTVVVAGDDAGPVARVLAESAGLPLLAEPTSGSRAGDHAIRTYRLLLGTALGTAIERVIVLGHPTLSRPVTALLSRPDVTLYAVRTRTRLCPGTSAADTSAATCRACRSGRAST